MNISCPNAWVFLTSDTIDILCLAYSDFCIKKSKQKLSMVSEGEKSRRIWKKRTLSQPYLLD